MACYGARLGAFDDTNLNEDFILESISSYDGSKNILKIQYSQIEGGRKM